MRAHFGHPGVPGDVPDDHGAIVQKAHPVAVHPQIAPVGVEDIPGAGRHFQRFQHLVHRITARFDKVGEVFLHILRVGVAVHRVGIGLGIAHFLAQFKEFGHGAAGTGHILLHLVDEGLHSKGHLAIVLFVGGDEVIGFGNAHPVDLVLHPQVPEQSADIAGLLRGTEIVELVEAGLKLKPAPLEAGGKSAGQVVLFQHQAGTPRLQHPDCGSQSAVAGADNHHVIGFCRVFFHRNLLFAAPGQHPAQKPFAHGAGIVFSDHPDLANIEFPPAEQFCVPVFAVQNAFLALDHLKIHIPVFAPDCGFLLYFYCIIPGPARKATTCCRIMAINRRDALCRCGPLKPLQTEKIAGSSLSAIFVLQFRCESGGGILPAAGDAAAQ